MVILHVSEGEVELLEVGIDFAVLDNHLTFAERESSDKESGSATSPADCAERRACRRVRLSFWAGSTTLLSMTSKTVTNRYVIFFERNFYPKFAKYKCKTIFEVYQSPKIK